MSDFHLEDMCDRMRGAIEKGWIIKLEDDIDNKGICTLIGIAVHNSTMPIQIKYCPWCGKQVSKLAVGKGECQLMRHGLEGISKIEDPIPDVPIEQIMDEYEYEGPDEL